MSGGGQQAPQAYQPANQAGADAGFQSGANQLSSTGANLSASTMPQLANITSNVTNNPYYTPAMAGATNAANIASTQVAPQQLSSAQGLAGLSSLAGGAAPGLMSSAVNYGNATAGQAAGYGQATAGQAVNAGQNTANTLNSYVGETSNPELLAGLQTLQTAYDPQQTLYNQGYQQNLDQQNAINSMNGVAGSPYAAGVTGQSAQNFNTNWQNQQLSRQIAGLGAYDSAASTAAGNVSNLAGGAQTALNSGLTTGQGLLNNGLTTGQSLLNNGISTGTGAFNTLTGDASSLAGSASTLGTAGLNTLASASQLPYDLYLQQQQAGLSALGTQIQDTNAANSLTQAAVGDEGQYLNIGQGATNTDISAAQANNTQANQQAAGLGSLFGDITGMFAFG